MEPFDEKNNKVMPICHKNLSGKVLLADFLFFNIFFCIPLFFLSIKRLQCIGPYSFKTPRAGWVVGLGDGAC